MYINRATSYFLLLVVSFFVFFIFPGANVLGAMEARNFLTAREMVEFGNWLHPTLNGNLRLEKPPLPTWITAFFGAIFGFKISVLRIPAAIMALLMVVFMYEFVISLTKKKQLALIAALVLATSFYIIHMGRKGSWDIYCHSFMFMAIYFLYRAWEQGSKVLLHHILAGIFMGLAWMSKGPVPLYAMLIPFVIAYFLSYPLQKFRKRWKYLFITIGIMFLIGFSWYIHIYFSQSEAASFHARKEIGNWFSYNVRPFWYYIDFPLHTGIWAVLLISALIFPYFLKKVTFRKEYKLALIWTIASLILLSLFPEKKVRYLLPVYFPTALLAAFWIDYLILAIKENKLTLFDKISYHLNFWIVALISLTAPVVAYFGFYQKDLIALWAFLLMGVCFWGIFAVLIGSYIKKNVFLITICMVDLIVVTSLFLLKPINTSYITNTDYKNIRAIRNVEKIQPLPYYSLDEFRQELVWEVGKRVEPLDFKTSNKLPENLPAVVFTYRELIEVIPASILSEVSVEKIGTFDNNLKSKDHKHYGPALKKNVFLLSRKE